VSEEKASHSPPPMIEIRIKNNDDDDDGKRQTVLLNESRCRSFVVVETLLQNLRKHNMWEPIHGEKKFDIETWVYTPPNMISCLLGTSTNTE